MQERVNEVLGIFFSRLFCIIVVAETDIIRGTKHGCQHIHIDICRIRIVVKVVDVVVRILGNPESIVI